MKVVKPETVVIALMVLAACGSRRLGPTRADAGADTPDALIEGAGGSAEVDGFAVRLDTKAPAAEGRDAVSVEAAAPDTTVSTCECGLASAATCDGWTLWEKVTASGAHNRGWLLLWQLRSGPGRWRSDRRTRCLRRGWSGGRRERSACAGALAVVGLVSLALLCESHDSLRVR